jgi:hypothetical protein
MLTYRVEFFDADGAFLGERRVPPGQNAQPMAPAPRPSKGWRFDHWEPQVSYVHANVRAVAVYTPKEYLVTFLSETGAVLKREYVPHGHDAAPPRYSPGGNPVRWNGRTQNIQRPQAFCAMIEEQIA